MSSPVKRSSGGDPLEHSKVSNFRPSLREQGLNTLGEQLGTTCSANKSRRQRMSEFWFLALRLQVRGKFNQVFDNYSKASSPRSTYIPTSYAIWFSEIL